MTQETYITPDLINRAVQLDALTRDSNPVSGRNVENLQVWRKLLLSARRLRLGPFPLGLELARFWNAPKSAESEIP